MSSSDPEPVPVPAEKPEGPPRTPAPQPSVVAGRTRRELWIELGVVFGFAVLPSFIASIGTVLVHERMIHRSPIEDLADVTMRAVRVCVPLLYIMWRSGEGWSTFGLPRPRPLDLLLGTFLLFAAVLSRSLIRFAVTGKSVPFFPATLDMRGLDIAATVLAGCAISFREELVMRGYFLQRLAGLLGSRAVALLLTAMVWAFLHSYQGWRPVLSVFVDGLLYGSAVLLFRRIWPGFVAHALYDAILPLK